MQTGLMADVHLLLCAAVAACALAVAAEAAAHGSGALAPTIARVFFTLLQGTWFFQAAHILYGAVPWDPEDDANATMLPVVFVAHMLAGAHILVSLFGALARACMLLRACAHTTASRRLALASWRRDAGGVPRCRLAALVLRAAVRAAGSQQRGAAAAVPAQARRTQRRERSMKRLAGRRVLACCFAGQESIAAGCFVS
jgi:hypothetical protein